MIKDSLYLVITTYWLNEIIYNTVYRCPNCRILPLCMCFLFFFLNVFCSPEGPAHLRWSSNSPPVPEERVLWCAHLCIYITRSSIEDRFKLWGTRRMRSSASICPSWMHILLIVHCSVVDSWVLDLQSKVTIMSDIIYIYIVRCVFGTKDCALLARH